MHVNDKLAQNATVATVVSVKARPCFHAKSGLCIRVFSRKPSLVTSLEYHFPFDMSDKRFNFMLFVCGGNFFFSWLFKSKFFCLINFGLVEVTTHIITTLSGQKLLITLVAKLFKQDLDKLIGIDRILANPQLHP